MNKQIQYLHKEIERIKKNEMAILEMNNYDEKLTGWISSNKRKS